MNEDHLKNFISQNRDAFDSEKPSEDLWSRIEKDLPKNNVEAKTIELPSSTWQTYVWRVAAALLISIGSILVYEWYDQEEIIVMSPANTIEAPNSQERSLNPELAEAEAYYSGKINNQLSELKKYTVSYPGLEEEVTLDLDDLDQAFHELQVELDNDVANEEVIEAMIENYQIKTEILEDILEGLQSTNSTPSNDESTIQL